MSLIHLKNSSMSDETEQKIPVDDVQQTPEITTPTTTQAEASNEDPSSAMPPIEPTRDLDAERDIRVIPVAQGVLKDLAGQSAALDINDRSEFTNVIAKIVNRFIDADLNVTMDNPYVWQLIISIFAAFMQVVMESKMAEPQDERYSKIAHEMMALIAGVTVPIGMGVKTEDQVAALQSIKPQLEEIFAREMLTRLEVMHIMEGLMNAMKVTNQTVERHVQDGVERMEAKILKLNDLSELTMGKLDTTLKTSIENL